MVHKKLVYALSIGALVLGVGISTHSAWAEGECMAANLAELEECLSDSSTGAIITTNTIVVSGEGTDKTLVINKNITGASGKDFLHIEDGAKLTLRGSGTITAGRYGAVADRSELVIDGVTIDATNPTCYGVFAKDNGVVTMESGQVIADYAAFAGNNTTGDMNFYINGGMLRSERYPAIYMPGQVNLEVLGGTIDGGIVARMGQISIEGGTINAQATPVENDGLDRNYNGMPSMAGEALTLIAGSYKSSTTDFGNSMNILINGSSTRFNGDIALYDLGNTASGYEQNVNVTVEDGVFTAFKTKFTEAEIGFALESGYTAGLNNAAGRISVELLGGSYTVSPDPEMIPIESEIELNTERGTYDILPKEIDYRNEVKKSDSTIDGQIGVTVVFGDNEFYDDRKATLSATEVDKEGLTLSGKGELFGAFEVTLLNRNLREIEVKDNDLIIYVDIDQEIYDSLSAYDHLYAVYFDEEGNEAERNELTLVNEEGQNYYFWFKTTHLSTYGVVGVNDEAGVDEESSSSNAVASTPDTGTVTMAGASASTAAIVTALVTGILTAGISFTYLYKKLCLGRK